jgi:hypothetical protein
MMKQQYIGLLHRVYLPLFISSRVSVPPKPPSSISLLSSFCDAAISSLNIYGLNCSNSSVLERTSSASLQALVTKLQEDCLSFIPFILREK